MYKEFLETCAYTPEEIEKELPRVKRAFDKAGLTEEDLKRGRERLIQDLDAGDLRGMRMIAGLFIKDFVDLVLSGEEHEIRLYLQLPSLGGQVLGAAQLVRPDIYVGYPSVLGFHVLGSIFNRLDPLLEKGENWCLPPAVAHCGCNQFKLGARLTDMVPPASLNLSAGMYCDEAPKVDEVLTYHFREPVFWFNRCQDENFDDPPMDERHLKYLSANVDRARQTVSEVIGVEVTKDKVMEAILGVEGCVKALSRITELRAEADPSPLRAASCQLGQFLVVSTLSPKKYKQVEEALRVLAEEVQGRIDRGEGVVEKGAPRVMLSYLTSLSNPGISKAMEDAGLNICCSEGYGSAAEWERRAEIAKIDPCDIIAGVYLTSPLMVKASWRIETIVNGYRKGNLDGLIMLPHYSCRVFGNDFVMIRDGVKKELGNIPTLILETDLFDPRYYTVEQSRTRIESFAEMVKTAKVSVS